MKNYRTRQGHFYRGGNLRTVPTLVVISTTYLIRASELSTRKYKEQNKIKHEHDFNALRYVAILNNINANLF